MADLDRAYVINGDDLRIALNSGPALVPNPRDMAEYILAKIATPAADAPPDLTAAFSRCHVEITVADATAPFADGYPTEETAAKLAAVAEREFAARQRKDADPWAEGTVVDAHVCCDHVPGSLAASELQQADRIVRMFQGYGPGSRHVRRVLRWAWDYLTDGDEPPF